MKRTVFLVEDDPLLSKYLCLALEGVEDMEVVGTVQLGADALARIPKLRPQILLLDLRLPDMNGYDLLDRLLATGSSVRTLVVTVEEEPEIELDAARHGAHGFLNKMQATSLLTEAVTTIAAGGTWFSPGIMNRILSEFSAHVRLKREQERLTDRLTSKEREVLVEIALGSTNQRIAAKLFMSVPTVKSHVRSILQKMELMNRTEAAIIAQREGLLGV